MVSASVKLPMRQLHLQRSESLVSFFYLLVLYSIARAGQGGHAHWSGVAVAASILGMASTEVMATHTTIRTGLRPRIRRRLATPGLAPTTRAVLGAICQLERASPCCDPATRTGILSVWIVMSRHGSMP